ncbi:hypothetical protein Tco_1363478 [Tanacetum coccineum]
MKGMSCFIGSSLMALPFPLLVILEGGVRKNSKELELKSFLIEGFSSKGFSLDPFHLKNESPKRLRFVQGSEYFV